MVKKKSTTLEADVQDLLLQASKSDHNILSKDTIVKEINTIRQKRGEITLGDSISIGNVLTNLFNAKILKRQSHGYYFYNPNLLIPTNPKRSLSPDLRDQITIIKPELEGAISQLLGSDQLHTHAMRLIREQVDEIKQKYSFLDKKIWIPEIRNSDHAELKRSFTIWYENGSIVIQVSANGTIEVNYGCQDQKGDYHSIHSDLSFQNFLNISKAVIVSNFGIDFRYFDVNMISIGHDIKISAGTMPFSQFRMKIHVAEQLMYEIYTHLNTDHTITLREAFEDKKIKIAGLSASEILVRGSFEEISTMVKESMQKYSNGKTAESLNQTMIGFLTDFSIHLSKMESLSKADQESIKKINDELSNDIVEIKKNNRTMETNLTDISDILTKTDQKYEKTTKHHSESLAKLSEEMIDKVEGLEKRVQTSINTRIVDLEQQITKIDSNVSNYDIDVNESFKTLEQQITSLNLDQTNNYQELIQVIDEFQENNKPTLEMLTSHDQSLIDLKTSTSQLVQTFQSFLLQHEENEKIREIEQESHLQDHTTFQQTYSEVLTQNQAIISGIHQEIQLLHADSKQSTDQLLKVIQLLEQENIARSKETHFLLTKLQTDETLKKKQEKEKWSSKFWNRFRKNTNAE